MKSWGIVFALLVLAACGPPTAQLIIPIEGMGDPETLKVPLEETEEQRAQLKEELSAFDSSGIGRRPVYEQYIDSIGLNGILEVLKEINPTCHDEAHDLGKIVFAKLGDIGSAQRACDDGCYSGCMHGVMMEAFATVTDVNHISISDLKPILPEFCFDEKITTYNKPGDCAHGVGHALMFISGYDIDRALSSCVYFDNKPMEYYCATGAYMEYLNNNEEKDAETKDLFHPCATNKHPAACFRYKMNHVLKRVTETGGISALQMVAEECQKLDGFARLGCFHGFGNAHQAHLTHGIFTLDNVCGFGNDQDKRACIDGAIERLAKYHPEETDRVCDALTGEHKQLCLDGAERDMYDLEKDFSLYFS